MRKTICARCCGLAVDTACKLVAVAEMIMGTAVCFMFAYDLAHPKQEIEVNQYQQKQKQKNVYYWAIFVCSGVQCLMGVLLYCAVSAKDLHICRFWQYTTLTTSFFTFPYFLRLAFVCIVSDFYSAVCEENEEQAQRVSVSPAPAPQAMEPTVSFQQFLVPTGMQRSASTPELSQTSEIAGGLPLIYFIKPRDDPPPEYEPPPPYHVGVTMPTAKL